MISSLRHPTAIFKDSTIKTLLAIDSEDKMRLDAASREKLDDKRMKNSWETVSEIAAKTEAKLVKTGEEWTLKIKPLSE